MTDAERTIFETLYWTICLRTDDQEYLGRAVVVCKRAVASIPELTADEWSDLQQVMKKYEYACVNGLGATMFNWTCLMNEAYQHQLPDPLVHWHVRPRYAKSVKIGGETFTDERFGHHYERKTDRAVSDDVAKEILRVLKKCI